METLAAHLWKYAREQEVSHHQLQMDCERKEAAHAELQLEVATLSTEIQQYQGWLDYSIAGGEAFRTSKALVDEQDRQLIVEAELAALRNKLSSLSAVVGALSKERLERVEAPSSLDTAAASETLEQIRTLIE